MEALLEAEGGKRGMGAVEELKLLTNRSGRFEGMAAVALEAQPLGEATLRNGKVEGIGEREREGGKAAMIHSFNTKFVSAGKGAEDRQQHQA
eukprot:evm.model.NODE_24733_length_34609_cov_47.236671.2